MPSRPGIWLAPARRLAAAAAISLLALGAGGALAQNPDKGEKGAPTGKAEGKKAEQGKAKQPQGPPKLAAKAWILIDPLDDAVLAAKAPERERSIASTTKLMTAYLALQGLKPKETLKAAPYKAAPGESIAGISAGEKLTVKDLLYGLLLPSGNDAAQTLAIGVAGSEQKFVVQMNNAAKTLGLDHTSYANPIGLDESGNFSSAEDLVTLADELLADDLFARIVDTPKAVIGSGSNKHTITTRNTLLLSDPSVVGVKTGHTAEAGYVLVAAARRDGTTLISAVLGAASEAARDAETKKLLEYGFSQYKAQVPVKQGQELAAPELDYRDEELALVAKREIPVSIRKGQQLRTRVTAPDEVEGPIKKGETLGRVVVTVDGRIAGASPLVAARGADEASIVDKAKETLGKPVYLIPVGVLVIVVGLILALRGRRGDDDEDADDAEGEGAPEPEPQPAAAAPSAPKPKPKSKPRPKQPPPKPSPQPPARPQAAPPTEEAETPTPKRRRLRRERKPKGPPERTPEERRQKAMERARRRKEREQ